MNQARIIILTGPGKGKTTSALGTALRALGHGHRVLLIRFCKSSFSGELALLESMPRMEILAGDCGMTPPPNHPEFAAHAQCAQRLFDAAATAAPRFDMIILDEICGAIAKGLIAEKETETFLATLRPDQTVILTGRDAGLRLIAAADTVSEILPLKHGYHRGVQAQDGVER